MVSRQQTGRSGVRIPTGKRDFLCSKTFIPALGNTESPTQWVIGTLSPEVYRPGREADVQLLPRLGMNGAKSTFAPVCLHGVERDVFLQFRVWRNDVFVLLSYRIQATAQTS
jgi:hypothetical protein